MSLFGTDGIRGKAGAEPLTVPSVTKIAAAIARYLITHDLTEQITVARDTRPSGKWICATMMKTIEEYGIGIIDLGILPTPAIAWMTAHLGAGLGIMITASHNPVDDNGIKIINQQGYKISEAIQDEITEYFYSDLPIPVKIAPPRQVIAKSYLSYADHLIEKLHFPHFDEPIPIVFDAANGAGIEIGRYLLGKLGFGVTEIGCSTLVPINYLGGATHTAPMRSKVLDIKAFTGIALDGDADRLAMCDANGQLIDGDQILYALAMDMLDNNKLTLKTVVGTIMTNQGLAVAFKAKDIELIRTDVGDRNVSYMMHKLGAKLGGESSGHILLNGLTTTGDGLATGLMMLKLAIEKECSISELVSDYHAFPQTLVNLRVEQKLPFNQIKGLNEYLETKSKELGDNGRIIIRYSGTEPILRIMVESNSDELNQKLIGDLIQILPQSSN